MTGRRIVTRHLLRRTARWEQRRLERLQVEAATGDLSAAADLHVLHLGAEQQLEVVKEDRRRYRWAVVIV